MTSDNQSTELYIKKKPLTKAERNKKYYFKHKEAHLKKMREYYHTNREKVLAYKKEKHVRDKLTKL